MSFAYIIFPDVLLDALSLDEDNNCKNSKLFLGLLLKEKIRPSSLISKRFRGFVASYHHQCLTYMIVEWINKGITDEEINLVQLVLESIDRDGIENYHYVENYTPLLDLAKEKSDSFDVIIVCNNEEVRQKLKESMGTYSHFGKYPIFNSEEAFSHALNN